MNFLPALAAFLPRLAHSSLLLAQTTNDMNMQQPQPSPVAGFIGLLFVVVAIVSLWKIFTKAGQPGWASIIPIYNAYILCKIAGKPGWWVILFLIPLVNFVIAIIVFIGLAQAFGKSAGFGIGLALLGIIFLPILAFGDARYQGATPPALP